MNTIWYLEYLILGSILMVLASGCQRSGMFRSDDAPEPSDSQTGYYSSKAKDQSATDRVEAVGQPKKRIAILDFSDDTPAREKDLGAFAAEEIRRALFQSEKSILPPESKLDLNTGEFVQGDQVRVSQLVREGRKLGVAVLGIGRIAKTVFRQKGDEIGLFRQKQSLAAVEVEIKLFEVQTGREILSQTRSADVTNSSLILIENGNLESPAYRNELVRAAVRKVATVFVPSISKALEKLSWQGHVAKIIGPRIYVNAGRASGLVAGDILRVLTPGDDIYDPTTGAYLGHTPGQLKGTLEVVDFVGPDGAATEIHTGGNLREGDVVQLY